MADTLGSLIDKLCTVDTKMWNVQEFYYNFPKKYTKEKFLRDFSNPKKLEVLYEKISKQADLNFQRADLVDEIDALVARAIKTGDISKLVQKRHKTGK